MNWVVKPKQLLKQHRKGKFTEKFVKSTNYGFFTIKAQVKTIQITLLALISTQYRRKSAVRCVYMEYKFNWNCYWLIKLKIGFNC